MLHMEAFPGTWRRCCWRWDVCRFLTGNLILGRDRTKTQPWPLVSQKTDWVSAKWSLGTRMWEQHLLSLSPRVRCEGPSVMGTPRMEAYSVPWMSTESWGGSGPCPEEGVGCPGKPGPECGAPDREGMGSRLCRRVLQAPRPPQGVGCGRPWLEGKAGAGLGSVKEGGPQACRCRVPSQWAWLGWGSLGGSRGRWQRLSVRLSHPPSASR